MHACMYACMHACMYACLYVCMYVCMFPFRSVASLPVERKPILYVLSEIEIKKFPSSAFISLASLHLSYEQNLPPAEQEVGRSNPCRGLSSEHLDFPEPKIFMSPTFSKFLKSHIDDEEIFALQAVDPEILRTVLHFSSQPRITLCSVPPSGLHCSGSSLRLLLKCTLDSEDIMYFSMNRLHFVMLFSKIEKRY